MTSHASFRTLSALCALSVTTILACSGARATDLESGDWSGPSGTSTDTTPTEPETGTPAEGQDPGSHDPATPGKPDPKSCTHDVSILDVPGNGVDEDCSGKADDEVFACDSGLSLGSNDPFEAAKALGLCRKASGANGWGVLDAKYIRPDGVALGSSAQTGYGLLPAFGSANPPVAGSAIVALSSGTARAPGQSGYKPPTDGTDRKYTHDLPAGLGSKTACPGVTPGQAHDGVALEVKLRVPSNARSFTFAHQFFTPDYAEYVCSEYNDRFVVMMTPKPAGLADGNIVVDGEGNGLTVASPSLLRVCQPTTAQGLTFACPLGSASLAGTGFEGHASTGWLKTTVPVTPGSEITLRFAVWDSGDGTWDSTVLLDGFAFSTASATTAKTEPR